MWNFKKCPRCRGDVYIDEDADRSYEKCLQCGYEREMERVSFSRKNPGTEAEKLGAI
jgi:DNA-directed RNA polymerase subunit M/transcription elongation factor TFIIS